MISYCVKGNYKCRLIELVARRGANGNLITRRNLEWRLPEEKGKIYKKIWIR